MTVELYIHTELSNDVKERQATLAAARALYDEFHNSPELYLFIANIDPKQDPAFAGLTQLDAVVLGPRFVTLLEFKNCFNPIIATDLETTWYSHSSEGDEPMLAGKSINPFQQVRYARNVWKNYLRQGAANVLKPSRLNHLRYAFEQSDAWSHLSACILIYPGLHPDSQLSPLKKAQLWCHIDSVSQLGKLSYIIESQRLILTAEERLVMTRTLFHARPWMDNRLGLHDLLGYLHVQEVGKEAVRYPIHSYQEFTIGRQTIPAGKGHRVQPQQTIVSSRHTRLETDGNKVYVYDTDSKNGTFVNGRQIPPNLPVQLHGTQDVVSLGPPERQVCTFWFEPEAPYQTLLPTETLHLGNSPDGLAAFHRPDSDQ
ncbi:MAG: FHA domain-containing protein [Chloroflexi bacterium]|nr:FHA domain-containing protein [Chloroflexota bacterium]